MKNDDILQFIAEAITYYITAWAAYSTRTLCDVLNWWWRALYRHGEEGNLHLNDNILLTF